MPNYLFIAAKKKEVVPLEKETATTKKENTSNSKKVYAYVRKKLVGEYDSITQCASALGFSRAMIKRAIENGTELENGFVLSLTKK